MRWWLVAAECRGSRFRFSLYNHFHSCQHHHTPSCSSCSSCSFCAMKRLARSCELGAATGIAGSRAPGRSQSPRACTRLGPGPTPRATPPSRAGVVLAYSHAQPIQPTHHRQLTSRMSADIAMGESSGGVDKGKAREGGLASLELDALPWVEKYRPVTMDDVVSHKDILTTSKLFVLVRSRREGLVVGVVRGCGLLIEVGCVGCS